MSPEEMELYRNLKSDIDEVRLDVKKLLAFKWQIIGGSLGASLIVTGLFQLILIVMKK